jgi:hypothetical protein
MLTGSRELLRCQPLVVLECFHRGDDAAWRRLAALPGYRLLDASTADDISESTTNYVAFPPQVHPEVVGRVVRERCRILESGRLPAPTTLRRMAALEPALQSGP